jgi:hypothetical protein
MGTQMPKSQNLLVLFLLTTLFGFSGCVGRFLQTFPEWYGQPVTVAPGDRTPPTVELRIPDLGITLHPGDITQTIHFNDIKSLRDFFAMGFAEDPQGVQSISVLSIWDDKDCTPEPDDSQAVSPANTALARPLAVKQRLGRSLLPYYGFRS